MIATDNTRAEGSVRFPATAPVPSFRLLSLPGEQDGDAAEHAYQHLLGRLSRARESIEIHMYVWRADAVGHRIGRAVYEAAERGVAVRILKDRGAALFETQESNRKPFFPTPRPLAQRAFQWALGRTLPDSWVADDWDQRLGEALMAHPNVAFEWVASTHTKYYCIDERWLITGSLNLEDRHHGYHDIMVELEGPEAVRAFRQAQARPARPDGDAPVAFLLNDPGAGRFDIKPRVLELIAGARESIHVEMAYIGDEEVTAALMAAAHRGVRLSILFSAAANIGNDVNFDTLHTLMSACPVTVRLSEKMIHSKLMLVDGEQALLGSANFSVFSLQRAGELSLLANATGAPGILQALKDITAERWLGGRPVANASELPRYHRLLARLQQWHQRTSRNG